MGFTCKGFLLKRAGLAGCILLLLISLLIINKNGYSHKSLPLQEEPIDNAREALSKCNNNSCLSSMQAVSFQKAPPAPAADVLLLAYMRGGSTFTGEILGIRKNQFYVYEPLHKMAKFHYFKPSYLCSIHNENCSISKGNDTKPIETLRAIYKCDLNTFKKEISSWQLRKVKVTNLPKCEYQEPLCWSQILKSCRLASSRVSKVLRLTVGIASRLLDMLPNLKIVQLFRDPRAIINSRLMNRNGKIPHGMIKSLCKKIKQDCKDFEHILRKYPGRAHHVFYEDIATNPMEVSKLYDFVGFSSRMDDFLHIHSMVKSSKDGHKYATKRKDSAQTAGKWRTHIPWQIVEVINSECEEVYELLGYPQHKSKEDLSNYSIPLRIRVKKF